MPFHQLGSLLIILAVDIITFDTGVSSHISIVGFHVKSMREITLLCGLAQSKGFWYLRQWHLEEVKCVDECHVEFALDLDGHDLRVSIDGVMFDSILGHVL